MTAMRTRSLAVTTLALVSFVPLAFTMGCNKPAGNAPAAEAAATAPGTPAEKKLPGAETPEALVERMKAGAAKEDFADNDGRLRRHGRRDGRSDGRGHGGHGRRTLR